MSKKTFAFILILTLAPSLAFADPLTSDDPTVQAQIDNEAKNEQDAQNYNKQYYLGQGAGTTIQAATDYDSCRANCDSQGASLGTGRATQETNDCYVTCRGTYTTTGTAQKFGAEKADTYVLSNPNGAPSTATINGVDTGVANGISVTGANGGAVTNTPDPATRKRPLQIDDNNKTAWSNHSGTPLLPAGAVKADKATLQNDPFAYASKPGGP